MLSIFRKVQIALINNVYLDNLKGDTKTGNFFAPSGLFVVRETINISYLWFKQFVEVRFEVKNDSINRARQGGPSDEQG